MAKAHLRNPETAHFEADFRGEIAKCVKRARQAMGWSLEQLAVESTLPDAKKGRDPRQVAKWEDGKERPLFDALLCIPVYGELLIIELGRMMGGRVTTRLEFVESRPRFLE